jgi:formate dehydrogenase assembly factor FdhD
VQGSRGSGAAQPQPTDGRDFIPRSDSGDSSSTTVDVNNSTTQTIKIDTNSLDQRRRLLVSFTCGKCGVSIATQLHLPQDKEPNVSMLLNVVAHAAFARLKRL